MPWQEVAHRGSATRVRHLGPARDAAHARAVPALRHQPQDRLQVAGADARGGEPRWPTTRVGRTPRRRAPPPRWKRACWRCATGILLGWAQAARAAAGAGAVRDVPSAEHHHRHPAPAWSARPGHERRTPGTPCASSTRYPTRCGNWTSWAISRWAAAGYIPCACLDDHARYAVGLFACANERIATVQPLLARCFQTYGLARRHPGRQRATLGRAAGTGGALTRLGAWLAAAGHPGLAWPPVPSPDPRQGGTLPSDRDGRGAAARRVS